jgi:hypothetical protein
MRSQLMFFPLWLFPTALLAADEPANSPGLLFYLSGDHGFRAYYAAVGKPEPNFLKDVKIIPGGAKGSYLQCGNDQLLRIGLRATFTPPPWASIARMSR